VRPFLALMIAVAMTQGCSGGGGGGLPDAGDGSAGGTTGDGSAGATGSGGTTAISHCDVYRSGSATKRCVEYEIGSLNPSVNCALQGDVTVQVSYSSGPCSTAGSIGGCKLTAGHGTEIVYEFPPTTTTEWMTTCLQGGNTYVAP
jgi:hypothetical protein